MYLSARPEKYLEKSMAHLETILSQPESSPDDKAWAFVRKAQVMIAQDQENQALAMLNTADESVLQSEYGQEVEFLRGRALFHAGQTDEADLMLRKFLQDLTDRGDIYAQTALELGRINYQQYRDHDAKGYYDLVIRTQMGKDWYAAGKLGLAECASMQQRYDEAIEHYQTAVDLLTKNPHNRAIGFKQIQRSLAGLTQKLSLLRQYDVAIGFGEIEQQIAPADDIEAAHRFAQMHARRAASLFEEMSAAHQAALQHAPTENEAQWLAQQGQMITEHFERAAEQFLRVAGIAKGDDDLYGQCLWQGATCFDKGGNTEKAIECWQRFVNEREGEQRWPRAMFNLGQAYQSAGLFDKAINVYETLRLKNPKSLAAFDGIVPLARSYLAKEPPDRERAEQILSSLLKDPTLTPRAPYFRDALFELGELYYKSQNYSAAINILTEAIERYPQDVFAGKSMFLVGDSYRKSGLALDATLAELAKDPTATINRQKTSDQRRGYLENAWDFFNRTIEFYGNIPEERRSDIDKLYLRHCWLYRADCLFNLGRYREAAEQYELAALRYQLTPTALAAFAQSVNWTEKSNLW
jgi:tetratricopeptide (TPR) repeat protein